MSDSLPPSTLQVETLTDDQHVTVILRGEVDMATAPQFEAVVSRALDDGARELTIDLAGVGFFDSTGVSVVALVVRRLAEVGARPRLLRCPDMVRHVLTITALAPHLHFVDEPSG